MNNWTSPRPSMIDLGKKSKVALLAGCGGGFVCYGGYRS